MEEALIIAPGEVGIFSLSLDAARPRWRDLLPSLDPAERERASEYVDFEDFVASVVSRGCLRWLLAALDGRPPERQRLGIGEAGKPCAAGPFRFSVSHSGGVWACAMTSSFEVGLDVEALRAVQSLPDLVQTICGPEERTAFWSRTGGDPLGAFFRLWVRKEAVLKAEGCGLRRCPRTVLALDNPGGDWEVVDIPFDEDFRAALAYPSGERAVIRRFQGRFTEGGALRWSELS